MIKLRCPDCNRMLEVDREPEDPAQAVEIVLQCDRCDDGDFHSPVYYDKDGKELLFGRDY